MVFGVLARPRILLIPNSEIGMVAHAARVPVGAAAPHSTSASEFGLMTAQERLGAGQPSAKLDRILERARENAVECRKFSY
jgi:hypothetical protein